MKSVGSIYYENFVSILFLHYFSFFGLVFFYSTVMCVATFAYCLFKEFIKKLDKKIYKVRVYEYKSF